MRNIKIIKTEHKIVFLGTQICIPYSINDYEGIYNFVDKYCRRTENTPKHYLNVLRYGEKTLMLVKTLEENESQIDSIVLPIDANDVYLPRKLTSCLKRINGIVLDKWKKDCSNTTPLVVISGTLRSSQRYLEKYLRDI